jgi:hypothetical protein
MASQRTEQLTPRIKLPPNIGSGIAIKPDIHNGLRHFKSRIRDHPVE